MTLNRRSFLGGAAAAAVLPHLALAAPAPEPLHGAQGAAPSTSTRQPLANGRFGLRFAPHFGMFRASAGESLTDQLRFMADEGFTALEDNGMPRRDERTQDEIAETLESLGMTMGVFVAHADFSSPTFTLSPEEARPRIEKDMHRAVEVAKRVNAQWCTVVPGAVRPNVELDYQTANVIDNLRFAAEILEPAGLCAVLEPLNPWRDHPGLILTKIPYAFMVCRAVNSPSVKILDDLYHQQITEGNLTGNLDRAWDEIAYIQVGDHPGRKEPGTGEIHYGHLFRHLKKKGYEGIVGMEHGNSLPGKAGERALIDAYVAADSAP